jgi:hypothetical protein
VLPSYELGIDRQKGMLMSAQRYLNVSQLRELLLGMERDLGLGKLTQNGKDIFYAVQLVIAANGGVARSEDIKNHELTRNITQPTFHKSLKSLVSQVLRSHAPNTKAGSYISPEGVRAPMPAELSAIV